MKINSLLFLFLMILPLGVLAQEGLGDLFKQAGADFGKENALGSQPENNNPQNQNNSPSPAEQEQIDRWKEMFERAMANVREASQYFNTPELKCIFTMVIYTDSYIDLVELIEATEDDLECQLKYDLYGMQAMAIATSTTMINCPEGLYKMNEQERAIVYEDLIALRNMENKPAVLRAWLEKYERVVNPNGDYDEIEALCAPFTPNFVIKELMLIRQRMEALGCGG